MAPSIDSTRAAFRELLQEYRASAGLSQEALAARSGISTDAISMLERGVRTVPRNSTVIRLADALHLPPVDRDALIAAAQRARDTKRRARGRSSGDEVPRELPSRPADFTGRAHELAALLRLLGGDPAAPAHPVLVTSIDGMAGVGKSALAIHAAHLLTEAGAFPDGQLYVNLQGAAAGPEPLAPLDALGRLLRSLGLDPVAIPGDLDEAAARFRSLAAGRRLLVLLDDARSADQVRPLLPGSPRCGVLVTSRQTLSTLEGVHAMHLDVLPTEQALDLLGRIAGRERTADDPEAAAEVVRLCGRLPLAIRIAGARLAARPGWCVAELVALLADATQRLEALHAGELAVRASFDVSLMAMQGSADPEDRLAAAVFGLTSLPDGPDLGVAAAARLLDVTEPVVRALLERLVDAQLMETCRPGRYQFHDLMRLYAREHAARHHPKAERLAALTRLIGFYVATAWRSLALLRPSDRRLSSADRRWTGGALEFVDASAALNWLEAERPNLQAAIAQAARAAMVDEPGMPAELTTQLSQALFGLFYARGYWDDWVQASGTALEVARHHGDQAAQAAALRDLGFARAKLGRYAEAIACQQEGLAISRELGDRRGQAAALSNVSVGYLWLGRHEEAVAGLQESLAIARELGDRQGQARSLINLGLVYERSGRYAEAQAQLEESLAICEELGHRHGEAVCLTYLGLVQARLGRHGAAVELVRRSLPIFQEMGDRQGQAEGLSVLGTAYERLGRHQDAIASLRECLGLWRELGSRRGQAMALRDLGDALRSIGQERQVRAAWQEALEISESLQLPDAAEIRGRLAALKAVSRE